MLRCDFRTHHECTCPTGICRAQPQPAPLNHPSKSFTLQAIAFWVVTALIAGGTWQALQYGEHQYQTDRRR